MVAVVPVDRQCLKNLERIAKRQIGKNVGNHLVIRL